jgi:hypothetical protein
MLTAQVADFPMIFRVERTVTEERLAEPFSGVVFSEYLLPGNRGTPCSSQRFSQKALRLHVGLTV